MLSRVLSVSLLALSAFAQDQDSIRTIVTAEIHHNAAAPPEITRGDVMVFEGDHKLEVTDWRPYTGSRAGLELVVFLDDALGGSIDTQLSDVKKFIANQPPTTLVAVAYMRNGTAMFAQNFTADHQAAAKTVRLPLSSVGANASPYFALDDLIKKWPPSNNRHEVVMITDGIDRYGGLGFNPDNPYVMSAIQHAQRAGVVVYSIFASGGGHFGHSFYGINSGQSYLAQLSEGTGGESYYQGLQTPVNITPFFDEINQRLANQYQLSFVPPPDNKSGMKRIRLRTELKGVDLVTQERVHVPSGS